MFIELTPSEIVQGAMVGVMRQTTNLRDNRKDNYKAEASRGWQYHIEGALGEMAVAKALNLFWGGMGKLGGPDLRGLEIRTTPHRSGPLVMHKKDRDEARFILVTGVNGKYTLRGWLYGSEGKDNQYWSDKFDNGRPAFWIPQKALRPIAAMVGVI